MLPLVAAAAAPAIMQMGGSLLGGMFGGGDAKERAAAEARRKAIEQLQQTQEQTGESAFANEDPRARASQIAALGKMEEMYKAGGMDPQSQAALRGAMDQTAAAERGSRGAITANYAARGLGSGGAGLAAQLAAQQGGANRNAMAGTQAAGDARSRALQAMSSAGQMAGATRGQDYQRSGALDEIQKFNAGQRLNKSGMIANTYTGQAGAYDTQAKRKDEEGSAMGGGIGAVISGVGSKAGWW